ncbi:hypothetical protein Vafri_8915, partial [Volvox africanus]
RKIAPASPRFLAIHIVAVFIYLFFAPIWSSCACRLPRMLNATQPRAGTNRVAMMPMRLSLAARVASSVEASADWAASREAAAPRPIAAGTARLRLGASFFASIWSSCACRLPRMLNATQPRAGTNRVAMMPMRLSLAARVASSVEASADWAASREAAAPRPIAAGTARLSLGSFFAPIWSSCACRLPRILNATQPRAGTNRVAMMPMRLSLAARVASSVEASADWAASRVAAAPRPIAAGTARLRLGASFFASIWSSCACRLPRMLNATQPRAGTNRVAIMPMRLSLAARVASSVEASADWAASREAAAPRPIAAGTARLRLGASFFASIWSSCACRLPRMLNATQPRAGTNRVAMMPMRLSLAARVASSVAAFALPATIHDEATVVKAATVPN